MKSRNIALKAVGELCYGAYRILRYCVKYSRKSKFAECGENVNIGNRCVFTEQTLFVGSHVRIGDDCCFKSAHGAIRIGSHVMFGPGVHIHGGDHPVHEIGILLDECEKPEDCDGEVVIEDDCWIGARSIILKGVTIGKGSIVGAGAIVTHDIPPYSVYVGVPMRKEWPRFSQDELDRHIGILADRGY